MRVNIAKGNRLFSPTRLSLMLTDHKLKLIALAIGVLVAGVALAEENETLPCPVCKGSQISALARRSLRF